MTCHVRSLAAALLANCSFITVTYQVYNIHCIIIRLCIFWVIWSDGILYTFDGTARRPIA